MILCSAVHLSGEGRKISEGIRNVLSRYEAVALTIVGIGAGSSGLSLTTFPKPDSPLRSERFFDSLYARYDERFVYSAPSLATVTRRLQWSSHSPALAERVGPAALGYTPRLSDGG